MTSRLDDILGDGKGGALAEVPVSNHYKATIREAVKHSIEINGIHKTREHWNAIIDSAGQFTKHERQAMVDIMNAVIEEQF